VLARTAGQTAAVEIGRIDLARFTNPTALAPLGDNLYPPHRRVGGRAHRPRRRGGFGTLAQGHIETSNVKLIEEMVELMVAQRAYEVSTKVIQASDEMMGMANNLRRGGG
jgi:flagellar basal-body rod protein FlgG